MSLIQGEEVTWFDAGKTHKGKFEMFADSDSKYAWVTELDTSPPRVRAIETKYITRTISIKPETEKGKQTCNWHKWVHYVGAREVYDFCEWCDAKRFT